MKHQFLKLLISASLLLSVASVFGQKTETQQLKETLQGLEEVERDPATSAEVKELNHKFLVLRRQQLRSLLEKRLKDLQTYQARVSRSLSTDENAIVEASIRELTEELNKVGPDAQADMAAGQTAGGENVAASNTRSQPAARSETTPAASSLVKPVLILAPQTSPLETSAAEASLATSPSAAPQEAALDCSLFKKQPKTFSIVDRYICNLAKSVKLRKTGDIAHHLTPNALAGLDLDADFTRLVIILDARKGRAEELVRAEEARVDKQVGGGSSNAGSTSLVTKGNIPAILGYAVENGALAQDVSGTTITFRGNPIGIAKALSGRGLVSGFDLDDAMQRFLRRFSFGFSFDTDRGPNQGTFTANKQQLSEVTARAVLYDKRDPRRGEFKKDWEDFLATSAQSFLSADDATRDAYLDTDSAVTKWKDPAMAAWFTATQQALAAASPEEVESVLIKKLNDLPLDKLSPDFVTQLAKFEETFNVFLRDRNTILKKVGQAGVLTFDYSNQRNLNKPDLSTFKFIGEKGFFNGRVDLTGNAAFSLFNTRPAGVNIGRMRDANVALQLDGTFGSAEKTGVFVVSFAYKFQHLAENSFTQVGTIVPNTKGDISVGQLKLTVPIKGLGMKLPISLTFANRTELIKEKEVRANFGFTFDLDTIFAKFKPF